MKLLIFFTASLLVRLACPAPSCYTFNRRPISYTEDFLTYFMKIIYTADHDIVNLLVPVNELYCQCSNGVIFFVQADTRENGERTDQGLYILKDGNATKILDYGRDSAAADDDTKTAYFAAKDGIYSYDATENRAEKYGSVTDSLISIAKVNGGDVIYVLTDDHVLYKVTEEGTKKEKVDKVVNAQQIILDNQNNLYYYTSEMEVYALVGGEIKKIEGLPQNPTDLNFVKRNLNFFSGASIMVNNKLYLVWEDGISRRTNVEYQFKITAHMQAGLYDYYAHNKKIYKY